MKYSEKLAIIAAIVYREKETGPQFEHLARQKAVQRAIEIADDIIVKAENYEKK